jgi:lysozyme family protein
MKDNFTASLGFVFRHECVFERGHDNDLNFVITEDVPGDSGGRTKWGIDQASHPDVDIAGLTLDQATEIYRLGEWAHCRCDDLPRGVDSVVFDCAVNMGMQRAGLLLQRALRAQAGVKLAVDGEIGQGTVDAASTVPPWALVARMLDARRDVYGDIVMHHPGDGKFLRGWLNRVDDLEKFVSGLAPVEKAIPAA